MFHLTVQSQAGHLPETESQDCHSRVSAEPLHALPYLTVLSPHCDLIGNWQTSQSDRIPPSPPMQIATTFPKSLPHPLGPSTSASKLPRSLAGVVP